MYRTPVQYIKVPIHGLYRCNESIECYEWIKNKLKSLLFN